MYCVVIGKFSKRQEISLVILLVVYRTVKILLEESVDLFNLSIRLWMEGRGQLDLSA